MKQIRHSNEDLQEMIDGLKVGDIPVYDTVSNYEITKVPGGYLYKNEYCGLCFVPDVKKETVGTIKSSVAKSEPKDMIKK